MRLRRAVGDVDDLVPRGGDLLLVGARRGELSREIAEHPVAEVLEHREAAVERRRRGSGRQLAVDLPVDRRRQIVERELVDDLDGAFGIDGVDRRLRLRVARVEGYFRLRARGKQHLHREGRAFEDVRPEVSHVGAEVRGRVDLTAGTDVPFEVLAGDEDVLFFRREASRPRAETIAARCVGDRDRLEHFVVDPELADCARDETALRGRDLRALRAKEALTALIGADADRDVDERVEPSRVDHDLDRRHRAVRPGGGTVGVSARCARTTGHAMLRGCAGREEGEREAEPERSYISHVAARTLVEGVRGSSALPPSLRACTPARRVG